jgi:hypothetical protein
MTLAHYKSPKVSTIGYLAAPVSLAFSHLTSSKLKLGKTGGAMHSQTASLSANRRENRQKILRD